MKFFIAVFFMIFFDLIALGVCTYLVFWMGHSMWLFLLAMLLCWCETLGILQILEVLE